MGDFAGFDKRAMQFWHELQTEMNRDWFTENKARYETEWVAPMTALLEDVHGKLAKTYKPLVLAPPKIMRIHRDVRFSKDKAPYKTHIGAGISVAGKQLAPGGNAAMYVHLGLPEEFVGVGIYYFDDKQMAKWRKAVAGKAGAELATMIGKLRGKGFEVGGHEDYKRVPKPYDADHPRAELLKMRGLTGGPKAIPKGMLHKPQLATWLAEQGAALAPMVKWLQKHVA